MVRRRIAIGLADRGHTCSVCTIGRWLERLGISRRRDLDLAGENNREPRKITARFPVHMFHFDVKKVGKIPDGGDWRIHGRGSTRALAGKRAHKQRTGYTYLYSVIDGYSRLAYTEALENETAQTTIEFFARARAFFAAHGITRLVRAIPDNGSNYRARTFVRTVRAHASRHQRTRPFTPRHSGKVERYQRILTEGCLYARAYASEDERCRAISSGSTTTADVSLGAAGLELAGRVSVVLLPRRGRGSYSYSPRRVRFDGHVRLRCGVAGARPAHCDGLIRRLSVHVSSARS